MSTPFFAAYRKASLVALAGGIVLAGGMFIAPDRAWSNLLLAAFYLLTVALGGAVFVALTYVAGAGWHVAFRRVPEAMAGLLPAAGAVMLLVLAVNLQRYGWSHEGHGGPGTFWFKQLWLTPTYWLARSGAYMVLWTILAGLLVGRSRRQDEVGGAAITAANTRLSALFLALFAVTFSLASVDWLMALEPLWFSTMWGVYQFAGMFEAALAAVIVLALVLRRPGGPLHGVFNDEHLHDLGKLLLGFSCFWMYIWFSQYMLIWYSNLPEETSYFISRMQGAWGPVVCLSIVLNWIVPFFVLLPRPAKRSAGIMMKVAVVVLIGRWVDLYVMIFPSTIASSAEAAADPVFGLWEVAAISLLVACGSLLLLRSFAAAGPLPRRDPFLEESLDYHAA